jgi:peptide/nickel transport system permease protein
MADTKVNKESILAEAPAGERSAETSEKVDEAVSSEWAYLGQWALVWRRFKKNKLSVIGGVVVILLYILAAFAEFLAPYMELHTSTALSRIPPQRLHFFDKDGKFHLRPFVYGFKTTRDPRSFRKIIVEDTAQKFDIHFFIRGDEYKFWGLWRSNIHLFGVKEPGFIYLFGADNHGRDLLTRMIYGTRISLSVGLLGVAMGLFFGAVLGTISGYYGGWVDIGMQRMVELLSAFPAIPLWMALAAALPPELGPLRRYFLITVILSFLSWGGLSRVVRGIILSYREKDFVMAAKACGVSEWKILFVHLIPGAISYLIVSATLAIPGMIFGETALSFLGVGMRPPLTSWGVLLEEARQLNVVMNYPWLLWPAACVLILVVAVNFLGDGLRDAADPYSRTT